ncbi:hypothetical protein GCM10009814_00760 [Lapillicoccus jejuensis]
MLAGQLDGLLAVAGLADDVVPQLAEHLREVEADERLVLGHDDAQPLRLLLGGGGLGLLVGRVGRGRHAREFIGAPRPRRDAVAL